jgi:hypothetical protein
MKPILAPHKEQDGYIYCRFRVKGRMSGRPILMEDDDAMYTYDDDSGGTRIISSRRVEEAVETADYLKRCAEEGLWAGMDCAGDWCVAKSGTTVGYFMTGPIRVEFASPLGVGTTLREAYWRYKNAVAR